MEKYGPLASVVQYGTNLAAAAWGLRTAALGKGLWEPSVEDFPRAPVRMAGVIALVLIGLVFAFSSRDQEFNDWVPWAVLCLAAAVVSFLMDVGLRSALIVRCGPRDKGFFAGIWLTRRARDIVRGANAAYERQDLAPGQQPPSGPRVLYCSFPVTHRDKLRVWSSTSMSVSTVLVVGVYVFWNAMTTVAVAVAASVVALSIKA